MKRSDGPAMRILAVEHGIPNTRLLNEEVIDRVAAASRKALTQREIGRVSSHLSKLFTSTGLRARYVTDPRSRPIDLVAGAADRALKSAGLAADDLGFIIYGGVARGFLVPSCASAVQYALGASGVPSFDVLDACASWARAMQVAHSFLGRGSAEAGLIVNCECGFYEDYDVWRIRSVKDIETEGGFFTLGEAATATVVARSRDDDTFEFHSRTYGEYGDLAVLPIVRGQHYTRHGRQPDGPMRFFTRSADLTFNGFRIALKLMKTFDPLRGRGADVFVPHAGAAPSIDLFVKAARLESSRLIMTYHDYGNTASASIPLGLSLAVKDGRLARGDTVFAPVVGAGISLVSVFFRY